MMRRYGRLGLFMMGLAVLGAFQAEGAQNTRPLILVVIAPEAYQEGELKGVLAVLKSEHVRWVLGSTQAGTAQGMMQGTAAVDVTLDQVAPENFDGMIILGGSGAKMYLWFNADVKRLVLGMHKLRRPLGAVSIAPAALAYAGILTGRRASVLPAPEIKKLFEKNQVTLAGETLTVDGRLVTASASEEAAGLARAIAGMLPRKSRAKALETAPASAARVRPKPTVVLPGRK